MAVKGLAMLTLWRKCCWIMQVKARHGVWPWLLPLLMLGLLILHTIIFALSHIRKRPKLRAVECLAEPQTS